jgi:CHC2 zinc finger/Suppressor of fused protein (SUFU)
MARVPDAEIERLKSEASLVSLAEAAGVELRRTGSDFTGRCPFHEDSTPSLVISPGKNLWHCLGACQSGGSVIDWVMRSEGVSFRHVELLAMVANLHADVRYRLRVGNTVNIGRPWAEGSAADHLLVSLPYPYGPALEMCELGERHVRFLWLVPITAAEANLVRSKGLEALESLLEQGNVDVPLCPTTVLLGT